MGNMWLSISIRKVSPSLLLYVVFILLVPANSFNNGKAQCRRKWRTSNPSSPSHLSYACELSRRSQTALPLIHLQRRGRSMALSGLIKNWWEDDLPNILGINPLEAAFIFGALYYFYGPTTLYEYAREAGKFVSTYTPIVKDVSSDIFNEFRDYLEEDRDRDRLAKQGVDISKFPRRTTNILERFQQSFAVFNELTSTKNDASAELQRAYSSDRATKAKARVEEGSEDGDPLDGVDGQDVERRRVRRSKKDVLLSRNVDIDKVMTATENIRSDTLNTEIAESASLVKERLSALKAKAEKNRDGNTNSASMWNADKIVEGQSTRISDYDSNGWPIYSEGQGARDISEEAGLPMQALTNGLTESELYPSQASLPFDNNYSSDRFRFPEEKPFAQGVDGVSAAVEVAEMQTETQVEAQDVSSGTIVPNLAMSKFQQQMSGEWNQRVLRKEKYNSASSSDSFLDNRQSSLDAATPIGADSYTFDEKFDPLISPFQPEPLPLGLPMETSSQSSIGGEGEQGRGRGLEIGRPYSDNIPAELSAFDVADTPLILNQPIPATVAATAVDVLRELDRDYLSLRNRLLDLLSKQEAQDQVQIKAQVQVGSVLSTSNIKVAASSSDSISENTSDESYRVDVSADESKSGANVDDSGKRVYWPPKSTPPIANQ